MHYLALKTIVEYFTKFQTNNNNISLIVCRCEVEIQCTVIRSQQTDL